MDYEVAQMEKDGKLHIPKEFRRALGWNEGTAVVIVRDEDCLRIMTPQGAVERAQRGAAEHVPPDRGLAEEPPGERCDGAARE
jgi:AbrB family looped-hinge helix DNA binding protein